ncbi:PREDICTED: kinesin-related protein 4-like [Dinoponera quadriceps]|uniref:Kinesin-related protein 4-like n=1 Tax=Dinoponera quadriceps TaxID=609295 RepID=A0A6P3Y4D6_DINQU|nr:PREDICTED: kinesin-related protein 4-like [Dinoponera quadriceps]
MSENSEHPPDDTEAETKATKDVPNDSSKSETKLMMDQTDVALLEDEEMPTYISVSSISRRDDSTTEVVNAKQPAENVAMEEEHSRSPYHSDDQAPSSVCILSSEEETDQLPYNDEDDDDEYGDSDDMENLEHDNDSDPNHMKHMLDEEEDDDDDDEEEEDEEEISRRMHNDDEIYDDYYDRVSADVVLNKRTLKRRDKEKSSSLQDLSIYRNNMYTDANKGRQAALVKRNYLNIPSNVVMLPVVRKNQVVKLHNVQSKVKLYIQDIKEQSRRSMEKHTKEREDAIHGKSNTDKNSDTEETKPAVTSRTIKSYAEKTIKELELAEAREKDRATCNASPLILNGRDNKKNDLKSIQEEDNIGAQVEIQIGTALELTQDKKDDVNSDDKKQNGISEVSLTEGETRQFGVNVQPSHVQNGHQGVSPVFFNVHTLTYEEYMRGTSKSSQKTDLNQNAQVIGQELTQSETYIDAEPMDVSKTDDNDEEVYSIRIEEIKHIDVMENEGKSNDEKTLDRVNEAFGKTTSDISEIVTLKDQLNQKTIQYNNLRDTYQKQFAENLKMKQELKELRKSLAKYEKGNKPPAQKVACIQTDFIAETGEKPPSTKASNEDFQAQSSNVKQHHNKISSSSVASTLSSIEQWTDSLSVSMKPPEAAKTLHSDDSIILTDTLTPRKNSRTLSHAFITSSRILQTLSNITQGKTKPESPLVQNTKKRLNENTVTDLQNDDDNYSNRPSSSKKRKITDVLGPSNFLQNFKASQNAVESKLNETPNAESQDNSCNINISQLGTATPVESKIEDVNDPEDNVKCFVYHENENSAERSFLIQAEQPVKDKIVNEKTRTRECGPFLLGNVEVRMSEINGTINIWGKEINEESITENENEMETSIRMKSDKKCYCWQKTRFNGSNIVCSSSKKSKVPAKLEMSSATSNISCSHSMSFSNTPKPLCTMDNIHADSASSPNVCVSTCEDCNSSKHRKEWLKYKRIHPEEKSHSCCTHDVETLSGHKCNCFSHKEKPKFEDSCNCGKDKCSVKEHRQSFSNNLTPKHLNENFNPVVEDNEHTCGYHMACHHSLHDPRDNCLEDNKHCNTSKEASLCEQLKMNTDQECNGTCNYHSSNVNEEEPLLVHKQCNETSETRRRRLSGKKVRNILMDFLRGCGDCYNPNAPSTSKGCSHKKEVPYSTSCSPQIKISPCAPVEPSCSNSGQSAGRCCHAYAQRIESQLEEFRVEMEKVRSRSDAILNMLNMLHSVDN